VVLAAIQSLGRFGPAAKDALPALVQAEARTKELLRDADLEGLMQKLKIIQAAIENISE